MDIIAEYTKGYCILKENKWVCQSKQPKID